MGFSGNGASSIRTNHAMIRSRGKAFVKYRNYVNVSSENIPVDQDRMDQLAKEASQSAVVKLALFIVAIATIIVASSLF